VQSCSVYAPQAEQGAVNSAHRPPQGRRGDEPGLGSSQGVQPAAVGDGARDETGDKATTQVEKLHPGDRTGDKAVT